MTNVADPSHRRPFLEATILLKEARNGGRSHPVFSGYRACWLVDHADGTREHHDGPILVVDGDWINPGERGRIRIHPLEPQLWSDVKEGASLTMCEGPNTIGSATVTRALHTSSTTPP